MGEHVRVIHDHDERAWIRQPAEQGLDQVNPRSPRRRDRRAALTAVGFPQRALEQAPEPPGLGVGPRRGEPGDPGGAAPDPVGEQHGLACPGSGGQQGKRQIRGDVELSQQAGPGNMPRR